jgi:hypothetical protein
LLAKFVADGPGSSTDGIEKDNNPIPAAAHLKFRRNCFYFLVNIFELFLFANLL